MIAVMDNTLQKGNQKSFAQLGGTKGLTDRSYLSNGRNQLVNLISGQLLHSEL